MDVTLTPDQEAIQRRAREFLQRECPPAVVRHALDDPRSARGDLWRQMAALGWLGFTFPPEYGGANGSLVDLALLFEEIGRALAPGPILSSSVLGGQALLAAGRPDQKAAILPRVAAGEVVLTVAQLEAEQDRTPAGIQTTAQRDGDRWLLNGLKLFVPDAPLADLLIVAARVSGDEEGIGLFLVEAGAPGLTVRPMTTFSRDWPGEVALDAVRVPASALVGDVEQGWSALKRANDVATVMLCAEMVGGMQAVLEMSVEYAKKRVQFGRPIGAFQAIQHKAVAMAIETAGARFLTYRAAWLLQHGRAADTDVAMAKAKCNRAYRLVTVEGHETHGGIGWSVEYDLQLYLRRRFVDELLLGTTDDHLETIAAAIEAGSLP
ncbi:MAG: acyl-CoA dehydrogenase family protein [Chloroflexota bacterium]|nr:acyl-CoA/acyl-ACP dehydrogenase [Dehalococcoidia bacterium]MDW8255159.1 acyl-CoA dehydrogenase family protein [Chloroflexota bacterium]